MAEACLRRVECPSVNSIRLLYTYENYRLLFALFLAAELYFTLRLLFMFCGLQRYAVTRTGEHEHVLRRDAKQTNVACR